MWQQSGFDILVAGADYYLISAHRWQPDWLDFAAQYPPEKPVFDDKKRRNSADHRGRSVSGIGEFSAVSECRAT